jgi:hypothetical protein
MLLLIMCQEKLACRLVVVSHCSRMLRLLGNLLIIPHFSVKYHWIRFYVDPDTGFTPLIWNSNQNNEADFLTEVMSGIMREKYLQHIMGWVVHRSEDIA